MTSNIKMQRTGRRWLQPAVQIFFPPLIWSVSQSKQTVAHTYPLEYNGTCSKSGRLLPMPHGLPLFATG